MSEGTSPLTADDGEGVRPPAAGPRAKKDNWFVSTLIAILLALGLRHFVIQAYKIPSGSMIPTLLVGDQLLANKFIYGIRLPFAHDKLVKLHVPDYGEIVVFRFPEDPDTDFIKRTIARPGDRIAIHEGVIHVNGRPVRREPAGRWRHPGAPGEAFVADAFTEYHGEVSYTVLYADRDFHPLWEMPEVELGPDEIFVMGDNRDRSNDSRFWGPVDLDLLQGQPLFIHWSWDSFEGRLRWSRLGTGL